MAKRTARKTNRPRPMLAAALFCERVLEEKDNVMTIVRMVDIIHIPPPEVLPPEARGRVVFPLVALLAFKALHARGDYKLHIVRVAPSGKRKKASEVLVTFAAEGEAGVNVKATVQAPMDEEGLHWYVVRLEGRTITQMPLRVVYLRQKEEQSKPKSDSNGSS